MRLRRITGSAIVVVGATSGVGRATALSLAAQGARLIVVARDGADVADVAQECRTLGATAHGVPADISRPGDAERIVAAA